MIYLIYKSNEVLLQILGSQNGFKHAADENMFPGTRIKQLMTYMGI